MWLLIETVISKPNYRLFSSREAAIQFLDWLHAESRGNGEFIRWNMFKSGGIEYKLEHLRVRDYQPGDEKQ